MAILVQCPLCGVRLKAPEQYGGRRVKCPGCKGVVQIPPPEAIGANDSPGHSGLYCPPKAPGSEAVEVDSTLPWSQKEPHPQASPASGGEESFSESFPDRTSGLRPPPLPNASAPALPASSALAGLPIWGWILVASALSGLIGGLVVYASLKLSAGPSSRTLTAQADKAKPPSASSGYPKQAGVLEITGHLVRRASQGWANPLLPEPPPNPSGTFSMPSSKSKCPPNRGK